ncbi:TetR/AcrR family transcriptional regulator [Nocardia farcinica]|uniref:HTH-type transcriptional repressor AcnR n=3 Tax=Nocardia farcinica TaxID=37329 RepID=A0A0H5NDL0_NOCFR|nr:TetR/AcrR family transcriptional regulator [Nocardia farcinica]AXK88759.1 TetR/AcrR family transcriptional regulator [Nocardia farcinica]MBA4859367.1 TetR/AcrR family transcriptional regulator [Nocardia farcinica]MBC9818451.1 TetR/AcrR family transcriptional regulator [Nocardia farcinica]MBF6229982.1 TetR/AcrR family transcriptional regulator [Nocardia farcinica]MBF6250573.1 TetR/AcrR family transcriptional regulator [Nocardia farcinica]
MADRGRPRSFDRVEALHAAMKVFWEHGYEGTSMSDLTAAMGINSPSLYAAFGDKESLFRAAIELYGTTFGNYTARALREEPTARAAVEAMLRDNAAAYTRDDLPHGCMVVLAGSTYTTRNTAVRDFLVEKRRETTEDIRRRLERGVAEGDLAPGTDTAALAVFYTTVLYGLSVQARDGATAAELNEAIDRAMAAWP